LVKNPSDRKSSLNQRETQLSQLVTLSKSFRCGLRVSQGRTANRQIDITKSLNFSIKFIESLKVLVNFQIEDMDSPQVSVKLLYKSAKSRQGWTQLSHKANLDQESEVKGADG
jgi:hypothetical protein